MVFGKEQIGMITKCRSCKLQIKNGAIPNKHTLVNESVTCPFCKNEKSIYHADHEILFGHSYECFKCNNYILYTEDKSIWKDEIYFSENENDLLIRVLENHYSIFILNNKPIHTFDFIFPIENIETLFDRLKSLIIFI